jgi:hypothetical protein
VSITSELYGHSLALLTDLYELTMAYGYWKLGMADRESAFCMQFREHPFGGGFTVACAARGGPQSGRDLAAPSSNADSCSSGMSLSGRRSASNRRSAVRLDRYRTDPTAAVCIEVGQCGRRGY